IFSQIEVFVFLKLIGKPVDDAVVKIISSQVCVSIGRKYFKNSVTQFQNGNVVCSTTEVKNSNYYILSFLTQSLRQCGSGRLVDDSFYLQTGNFTGFFGCLTL